MFRKKAFIIGGGVAGLTAAYEMLKHTDIQPVVLEMTDRVGGIAKTIEFEGNLMDIGGHRYFSKSDRVMDWWRDILPVAEKENPEEEKVLLERNRLSRIFYLRKFFDYPVTLSMNTVKNLGAARMIAIGASYGKSMLFPIKNEISLEDFFINRFGKKLYETFFKDYTEKVWGVPCSEIGSDWGAQRVKGVSVKEVLKHALKMDRKKDGGMEQKDVETSLIDKFLYPKYGAGQMWDEVAASIERLGGEIRLRAEVVGVELEDGEVVALRIFNHETGEESLEEGDYFLSSMPIRDLVHAMGMEAPEDVRVTARELGYRDFVSVGVLLDALVLEKGEAKVSDNWIYIQERDVKMGRIQLFHNWSPFMVLEKNKKWLGLEYFCNEGDEFWNMKDEEIENLAVRELARMGFALETDVCGMVVVRMPKAYPSYTGAYKEFNKIRVFVDGIENLFLIGRNGMHRYNNMDHSMLSAMAAIENIKNGKTAKENIWQINAEKEYHEEKESQERKMAP